MKQVKIEIRQAKAVELSEVRQLLVARSQWLNEQGMNQWQQFATYGQTKQTQIDFERGVLYVATIDAKLVGAIVITNPQAFDLDLWGSVDGYLYIHRFVVALPHQGCGIGEHLLQFAKQLAVKRRLGLRLDCRAQNQKLRNYYQKNGWILQREASEYACFEHVLG